MRAFNHAFPEPSLIAGKIRLPLRDWFPMEAKVKAEILHGVIRKFGAGGIDISSEEWGRFVAAQNDGGRQPETSYSTRARRLWARRVVERRERRW